MLRLALVTLVLTSAFCNLALAQQYCNNTVQCVQVGGNCGTSGLAAGTSRTCVVGSVCSSNTCTRQPKLGGTCTTPGIACYDDDYSGVVCMTGTCKYTNIYFPGESCSSDSNYYNGGCVLGSCVSGKCTSVASGGNCSASTDLCAAGTYCNDAGACVARLGSGVACSSAIQCQASLVCTTRGGTSASCQSLFTQTSGQGCDNDYDCAANLYCRASTRTCVAPVKAPSGDCSGDDGVNCGSDAFCVCDSRVDDDELVNRNSGRCEGLSGNEQSHINQFKNFQSCAAKANCQDLWYFSEVLDSLEPLTGPSQCASGCKHNLLYDTETDEGKCNFSGSAAGGLMPAVLLSVLVAVLALFF